MSKIWPLENEQPAETIEQPTPEWWEEMKLKQAIIDKQIADERRKNKS